MRNPIASPYSSKISVCAILLVLSALFVVGCEDYREPVTGRVTFRIPNDISKPGADLNTTIIEEPMAGILVEFKSLKDGSKRFAFTDCDGFYSFSDVRFGPNQVRTNVTLSEPVTDAQGNTLCEPTATSAFFDTRPYFIDILQDESNALDLVVTRFGEIAPSGITIQVRDSMGTPVPNARVDLYRGAGTNYAYISTRSGCEDGNYTFFAPPAATPTPTPTDAAPAPNVTTPTPAPDSTPQETYPPAQTPNPNIVFTPEPNPIDQGCPTENSPVNIEEFVVEQWRVEIAAQGFFNQTSVFDVGYFDVQDGPYTHEVMLTEAP